MGVIHMNKMNKVIAFGAVLLMVVLTGGAAFADSTVTANVTAMATSAFAEATPIVLAVAGAAVGLAVSFFGARLVLRAIKGGGRV
jgi:amino acid transporter